MTRNGQSKVGEQPFASSEDGLLPKEGVWWKHFLAGASAGTASRTLTAPLDRIKIYAQVHGRSVGPIAGIKYMINEGGFWSLWKGNGVNLLKVAPETATKFLVYEEVKQALLVGEPGHSLTPLERFIAGGVAGGLAQTIVYPLDVIKTRRVLSSSKSQEQLLDIVKKGIQNYGWKFFIRGYACNIIGILLFTGIDLAVYETMKKQCYLFSVHEYLKNPCVILSASTSCTVAQMSTYPFSMLGTTIQAQDMGTRSEVKACFLVVKSRLKGFGLLGLYKGSTAALVKAIPALSITYTVYETVLNALGAKMT